MSAVIVLASGLFDGTTLAELTHVASQERGCSQAPQLPSASTCWLQPLCMSGGCRDPQAHQHAHLGRCSAPFVQAQPQQQVQAGQPIELDDSQPVAVIDDSQPAAPGAAADGGAGGAPAAQQGRPGADEDDEGMLQLDAGERDAWANPADDHEDMCANSRPWALHVPGAVTVPWVSADAAVCRDHKLASAHARGECAAVSCACIHATACPLRYC